MIEEFRLSRVEYVPTTLEQGVLYVSGEFDIAVHLCACGCGSKVTTPLGPTEWYVREGDGLPTLRPSVGNWQLPCRSHYLITDGKTRWAGQWSDERIAAGRRAEETSREAYYATRAHDRKPLVRFWKWLRGFLGV